MKDEKKELKIYIKKNYIKEKKHINLFGFLSSLFINDDVCEDIDDTQIFNEIESSNEQYIDNEKKIYDWEDELPNKEKKTNLDSYIKEHKEYTNFQKTLFKMIDERNIKDSDVYNKVHLDRRTFAKIKNEKYHPSKETVILLAISLELNEKELEDLLCSAFYSLPKNNYYDLIIRFCFINKIYSIDKINELLEEYNCKLFNY